MESENIVQRLKNDRSALQTLQSEWKQFAQDLTNHKEKLDEVVRQLQNVLELEQGRSQEMANLRHHVKSLEEQASAVGVPQGIRQTIDEIDDDLKRSEQTKRRKVESS